MKKYIKKLPDKNTKPSTSESPRLSVSRMLQSYDDKADPKRTVSSFYKREKAIEYIKRKKLLSQTITPEKCQTAQVSTRYSRTPGSTRGHSRAQQIYNPEVNHRRYPSIGNWKVEGWKSRKNSVDFDFNI